LARYGQDDQSHNRGRTDRQPHGSLREPRANAFSRDHFFLKPDVGGILEAFDIMGAKS
jgi:hypothetical protein